MIQNNLFRSFALLITAITLSSCSSSDDSIEERHNWRLVSIQYNASDYSYQDRFSYDNAGRVVKWDRYQDDKCYSNTYTYANDKITVDNGLYLYECTLSGGRIVRQERVNRMPEIIDYYYDNEGKMTGGSEDIKFEWNGENMTKVTWGAIFEYTYTTIPNSIPFITSHCDDILEWQGYFGKRTMYLPKKVSRITYFYPKDASVHDETNGALECYQYDDYEYAIKDGIVTEVKRSTHTIRDYSGTTIPEEVYLCNWKLEYEEIK